MTRILYFQVVVYRHRSKTDGIKNLERIRNGADINLPGVGLYEDWLWLDERIESTTGEIEMISKREGNCQRLMSIPGVGPLISTGMVAAVGSGEAFDKGRDFAAWLGLVPRQYSTGGKTILGRISKRGSKYLRTLFVQAAQIILMRPHNWSKFSFGPWLEETSKRMHKNKLATALANKLARITWSILRSGKAFDTHRIEVTAVCLTINRNF